MLVNTQYRSNEEEWMDDFQMEGDVLEKTLRDIARINYWLGGNKITLNGVKELLKDKSKNKKHTIVDVGCGNGDMLRAIAKYADKKGYNLELIGVDANLYTINQAKKLSEDYPSIRYHCENIFDEAYKKRRFDILLCTLTLHHFDETKVEEVLKILVKQSMIGVVVNDLHRSRIAYYLFKIICTIFVHNPMAKNDGLISILRGFKRNELNKLTLSLKNNKHSIKWCWAFRYQWIINTIK